ncbi:MAG: hypothetical protein HYY78_13880 [Betaproteobacteria bacterium]|nr:hypothetical protein [Betaproteobacteria bacterium]
MPQQPTMQITYVDRPEVSETFADTVEKLSFDGQTLRMELCVTRMDDPHPPNPPTGKKYTACRLVLPPLAAIDLANKLQQLVVMLEQQGIVKRGAPPAAGTTH